MNDELTSADADINETTFKIMGGGSAAMFVIMFTVVGELALESIVYGAITGVFSGAGTFLFLPWFLHLSALQSESGEDVPLSDLVHHVTSSTQLAALGLGLELGGITMFAIGLGFTDADYVVGIVAALIVAVSVYLVASVLLDW